MPKPISASRPVLKLLCGSASVIALSISLAGHAAADPLPAAQEVQYDYLTAPVVASSNQAAAIFQEQTGDVQASIAFGSAGSDLEPSASAVSTETDENTMRATATGNTSAALVDTALASGTGSTSNGVLASALEVRGAEVTSSVTGSVRTTVDTPADGSSVSLSGNTLAAETVLSSATNILQGDINLGFANTEAGSVDVDITPATPTVAADSTAGFLLQSSQVNTDIVASQTDFSRVSSSNITLAIDDGAATPTTLSDLNIDIQDNAVAADFTASTADNLLSLQDGGLTTLSGTAGLNNVQVNQNIGHNGTQYLDTGAYLGGDSITATVGAGLSLTDSSLAMTDNTLSASSTLSTATNELLVADGVNVEGAAPYLAGDTNVQLDASSTPSATIGAADLFLNNTQAAVQSGSSSDVSANNGLTLTANAVSGSDISATGNAITAASEGNTATSSLQVAGATTMNAMLAGTNLQTFSSTTTETDNDPDFTPNVSAWVYNADVIMNVARTAGNAVTASNLALDANQLTADAQINTSRLSVGVTGTSVSDGQAVSDEVAPTIYGDVNNATVSSGFSATNVQSASGEAGDDDPSVDAEISRVLASEITLSVGNASVMSETSVSLSDNTAAANGGLNEAVTRLDVAANTLDASLALASVQQGTAGASASVDAPDLTLTVDASGGAADGLSLSADANRLTGTASGNTATNVMTVQTTTQTVTNAVVAVDPAASRTNLSNGPSGTSPDLFADMSLANLQSSNATLTSIEASVKNVGVVATLAAGALTDSTLSLDGNLSEASASANTATNTMVAEIGSFDLTDAVRDSDGNTNQAGGTSIAALGSNQFNATAVTALLDGDGNGGGDYQAVITGAAAREGVTVSADGNQRIAAASGNSATNMFDLASTSIVTPEANAPEPALLVNSTTGLADVAVSNSAFAIGNVQQNAGAITSTLSAGAADGTDAISAQITSTVSVTGSTVTVDANRVLARADAISATTDVTLDAANIQTSALVGSAQRNTGNVAATAGDADTEIAFIAAVPYGTQTNTLLSASQNVAGAAATGTSATTDLTIGGDDTASVLGSSTALVTAQQGSVTQTQSSDTADTILADYAVANSQTQTGSVSAGAASLLVDVDANHFVGGAINADENLLTAQAAGAASASSVDVSGGDLGTSGSAPIVAASNNQSLGGAVTATVSDAAVLVNVGDLNVSTAGESVSVDANTVLAQANGVTASTILSAAAGAGAGSIYAGSGLQGGTVNGTTGVISALGDRLLVSSQEGTASSDVTAAVTGAPSFELTIAAGVSGDTLSARDNTVEARASNLAAVNTLSNMAGTSLEASSSLINTQRALGSTGATVDAADTVVSVTTAMSASSVDLSSNTVTSGATGVSAANTLTAAAGSIDGQVLPNLDGSTAVLTATAFTGLVSDQGVLDDVTATVSGETEIQAMLAGAVSGSDVAVDANLVQASATAGTAANRLTQSADTSIATGSPAILSSSQVADAAADVTSTVTGTQIVASAASLTGSNVSADANTVQALTTGLSASNVLAVSAGTSLDTGVPSPSLDLVAGLLTSSVENTLSNTQTVGASTLSANIDAAGALAGDGAAITVAVAGDIAGGSSASVSSNMMRALVTGATSTNSASGTAGTENDAGLALVNVQTVAATLQAGIDQPAMTVSAANVSGNSAIDVSSNVIAAAATAASATNELTLEAGTGIAGYNAGTVTLTPGSVIGFVDGAARPSAALVNGQASSGTVTSTVGGDATIGEPGISVALSGAVTGTVALEDNALLAQSRGNVATNTVSLSAGSTIDATSQGVLASTQDRSGAINASISGSSSGSRGMIGITSAGAVDGSVSVDNNMVRASGAANTVLNSFTVSGGGSAGAPTGVALNAEAMSSNAQYAALNAQTNASSVTSSVSNFNMGLTNGTYGLTGMASLTGNTVMADATGNSAYNILSISSGAGTYGTASMANNQSNSANMSAQISGVSITMDMGAVGTGGAASLRNSGNAITANAVGNTATTIITRPR